MAKVMAYPKTKLALGVTTKLCSCATGQFQHFIFQACSVELSTKRCYNVGDRVVLLIAFFLLCFLHVIVIKIAYGILVQPVYAQMLLIHAYADLANKD